MNTIDLRDYQVTNVKPLPGDVIVELQLDRTITDGGIHIPEDSRDYPVEAIVRKMGPIDVDDPVDFVVGDRVIVPQRIGTVINQHPRHLKLVKASDILAVFV